MTTIYCDNVECKFRKNGKCSAYQIGLEMDECGWVACKGEYEDEQ